jgi:hypothetical protein
MRYRLETTCKKCSKVISGKPCVRTKTVIFMDRALKTVPKTCPECGTLVPDGSDMVLFASIDNGRADVVPSRVRQVA